MRLTESFGPRMLSIDRDRSLNASLLLCVLSTIHIKYSTYSLNTTVYLLQKQLHVSAPEGSLHQAVYKNKMEVFTVGWLEASKPYRYCPVNIHNIPNVGSLRNNVLP